jgi:arylsulfatase
MIESVDDGIGNLVRYLEETGELENTVIMFLSDNGGCHETLGGRIDKDLEEFASIAKTIPAGEKGSYTTYGKEWANASNTPFRLYKHWTHEGGISTPFIVHFPKLVKQGKIVHEVTHLIDIFPTILDLSNTHYPEVFNGTDIQPQEGNSLVPLFADNKWTGHKILFWEHFGSRAVRKGKWKLVSEHNSPWELYDMELDRSELNDLSAIYPDTVKQIEKQYQLWASRIGVQTK